MQALEASAKWRIYNIGIKLNYSNFVNSNNPVLNVETTTTMVPMQVCSISTTTMAKGAATTVYVRSA